MNVDVSASIGPDRSVTCDISVNDRHASVTFADGEVIMSVPSRDGEITFTVPECLIVRGISL